MKRYKRRGTNSYMDAFKCSDGCNINITNGTVHTNSDGTVTVVNKYGEETGKPCDYVVMTPYGPHVIRGVIFNYLFDTVES